MEGEGVRHGERGSESTAKASVDWRDNVGESFGVKIAKPVRSR